MKHDCHYVVFDLETGGFWSYLNPILEIALIIVDVTGKEVMRYENYIKPYNDKDGIPLKVEEQALKANGIKMSEVMEKGISYQQLYKDLCDIFKKYKSGRKKCVLVGHNIASFDVNFLEFLFDLCEARNKKGQSALFNYVEDYLEDTMWQSRKMWGHEDVDSHQLGDCCRRANIELYDAHRAMNDTLATLNLFLFFLNLYRNKEVVTVINSENNNQSSIRKNFYF